MQVIIESWPFIAIGAVGVTLLSGAVSKLILDGLKKSLDKTIDTLFLEGNTRVVNRVQSEFNKALEVYKKDLLEQIEVLKSSLSKENIAFQISHSEYTKKQYVQLEQLFIKAYEVKRVIIDKINTIIWSTEFSDKKIRTELCEEYIRVAYMSSFYLDEKSRDIIFDYYTITNALLISHIKYESARNAKLNLDNSDYTYQIYDEEEEEVITIPYTQEEMKSVDEKHTVTKMNFLDLLKKSKESFDLVEHTIKVFLYKPSKTDN